MISMLSPSTALKIARKPGIPWVLKRTSFALQTRLGILERRLPISGWDFDSRDWLDPETPTGAEKFKQSTRERCRFFPPAAIPESLSDGENVCRQADRVLGGEWPFFSRHWLNVGFPPDWHLNKLDGKRIDHQVHWSRIDIDAIHDVKFVWEPSRFSAVYLLVRAYGVNRDERYAEAFWKLVEDWAEKNPPNVGANWICGQEAVFRVMAWSFGLFAFFDTASTTSDRIVRLVRMIEKHGERIAGFIDYALSQRNNHGISEAVGLFTIGVLFPQLRRSKEWLEIGRELIIRQLRDQIYEDGSYIQHSFNYERLVLDELLWAIRLGELNDFRFPQEVYESVAKAAGFMLRFCDEETGRMPNCGGNDGSLVLPLTSCDYTDFRPTIQAAYYLVYREFCFETGPWNELAERLFSENCSLTSGSSRAVEGSTAEVGETAYLKMRGRESYCLLRAAKYRDRPAHADQLHLDMWWRGENVAGDAGTYLYNGNDPWANGLARTEVHNTVTVADHDQMTRAGRFLWLDWAKAEATSYSVEEVGSALEAEHDGYRSLGAVHRRSVLSLPDWDTYLVVDDIFGNLSGEVRLHWLFGSFPFTWQAEGSILVLSTTAGEFKCANASSQPHVTSIAKAGEIVAGARVDDKANSEIRGWRSLYYGEKEPALSLAVATDSTSPVRFVTVLAPSEVTVVHIDGLKVALRCHQKKQDIVLRGIGCNQVFLS